MKCLPRVGSRMTKRHLGVPVQSKVLIPNKLSC